MNTEKTSKVKEIKEIKEYTNSYGTTYYHSLLMDNDEIISLGKKKKDHFKVGDEITYIHQDDGKFKQVFDNNIKSKFIQEPYEQKIAGLALSYSKDLCIGGKIEVDKLLTTADRLYEWLLSKKSK